MMLGADIDEFIDKITGADRQDKAPARMGNAYLLARKAV
jgi:hypothetical protein